MLANLQGISHGDIYPHGWYVVVDEEGMDKTILVYDNQLEGYETIAEYANEIISSAVTPDAATCLRKYFDIEEQLPLVDELQIVIDMLKENGVMPNYYTFEQRDEVDVRKVAETLRQKDMRLSEMNQWLQKFYEEKPILKELYREFSFFSQSVFNELNRPKPPKKPPVIITVDEREGYEIIPDLFDLSALRDEVIGERDATLNPAIKPDIRWTNHPLRSYFGQARRFPDGRQDIQINSILSSRVTPREIIKYQIYHELLHSNGYWNHNEEFRTQEWAYPNSAEHDAYLDQLGLHFKIEDKFRRKRIEKGSVAPNPPSVTPTSNTVEDDSETALDILQEVQGGVSVSSGPNATEEKEASDILERFGYSPD
jgi:hypothetical protein